MTAPQVAPVTGTTPADGRDAPAGSDDADPPLSLDIDVVLDGGDWSTVADAEKLVRAAAAALASELALSGTEACVALSSDAHVAELNASYRGKPAPTNVLSFGAGGVMPDGASQARFLGDVVLAQETLQREAAELELPLDHHMQHLVVHGLLHLLGYDHRTDEEARSMEGLEVRVLARLGVVDPYAGAGEPIEPPGHVSQRPKS
jgi:probable rRNA maturation factor